MSAGDSPTLPPSRYPSRLIIDVVAAQLLEEDAPHATPSFPSRDDVALPPRPLVASLPLRSIARAEKDLRRHVLLSSDATHISFSKDDIAQIHDPELLAFLEENSTLLSQSLDGQRPQSGVPTQSDLPTALPTSAADINAHILSLQAEIDTFITAVDNKGRSYRINLSEDGTLQVPVEDDSGAGSSSDMESSEAEAEGEGEGEAPTVAKGEVETTSPTADVAPITPVGSERHRSSHRQTPPSTWDDPPRGRVGNFRRRAPRYQWPTGVARDHPLRTAIQRTSEATKGSERSIPEKPAPAERAKAPPHHTRALAQPRMKVRRVRALLPEEEERIETLLGCNFATPVANPFTISEVNQRRLAEIEVALERMQTVRGDTELRTATKEESTASSARRATSSTHTATSDANARGNAYMVQVLAEQTHKARLRRVNAELRRIHNDLEALAMAADSDLPESVFTLRPQWARERPALLSESEVLQMVEEARMEQSRAELCGLSALPIVTDPMAHLLRNLEETRLHALSVVEKADTEPLTAVPDATDSLCQSFPRDSFP